MAAEGWCAGVAHFRPENAPCPHSTPAGTTGVLARIGLANALERPDGPDDAALVRAALAVLPDPVD